MVILFFIQDDVPMKLFVGRLAQGTTEDDVNEYFSDYGELVDVFVPQNPFRGFGFITFSSHEDGQKVLSMNHMINVSAFIYFTFPGRNFSG